MVETSLENAIRLFNQHGFKALPVVERGKVLGIVTLKDLVQYIWDQR